MIDRVHSSLPFFCDSSSSFFSFSPLKILLFGQLALDDAEICGYHQTRQTEDEHHRSISSRRTSQEHSKKVLGFFPRGKEKLQNLKVLVVYSRYNYS